MLMTESLVMEHCCECGMAFAMPSGFKNLMLEKRKEGRFCCPAGHNMFYTGESDKAKAERLARDLAAARDREATMRRENEKRWRLQRAAEGKTRALKKRVAAGVCPCCQRSFENLRRHMQTKHPNVAREEVAA